MYDLELTLLMKGQISAKKAENSTKTMDKEESRFELSLSDSIKQYIDEIIESQPSTNQMISSKIRREKLELEIRESVDYKELKEHLEKALNIIVNEGSSYLNKDEYQKVLKEIDKIYENFILLDLNQLDDASFKIAVQVSNAFLEFILKVCISKCNEGLLHEAISLAALLTFLESTNPDYWYRLGLIAHQLEQYDLALRSYQEVTALAPEFTGSLIFTAKCYLEMNELPQASEKLMEAKKSIQNSEMDQKWKQSIIDMEYLINNTA